MITSVTHLTLSIGQAYTASKNNKALGPVILAKGNDGTAIVIEARFPNRREPSYRAGYLRFGASNPVWCVEQKLPVLPLSLTVGHDSPFKGLTLDEAICRELVTRVVDMANATEAEIARRATAQTVAA